MMCDSGCVDVLRVWRVRDNLQLILNTWLAIKRTMKELNLKKEEINILLEHLQDPAFSAACSGAGGDSREFEKLKSFTRDASLQKKYINHLSHTANQLPYMRLKLRKLIKKINSDIDVLISQEGLEFEYDDENKEEKSVKETRTVSDVDKYKDKKADAETMIGVGEFHDVEDSVVRKRPGLKSKLTSVMRRMTKSKNCNENSGLCVPYFLGRVPSLDSLVIEPGDCFKLVDADRETC